MKTKKKTFRVTTRFPAGLIADIIVRARYMMVSRTGMLALHNGGPRRIVFAATPEGWLFCGEVDEDTRDYSLKVV